jgi:transcriptional regulator
VYLPSHFTETRPEVLYALIQAQPLAVLVTAGAAGLDANHLPLCLALDAAGEATLLGHVARANPLWRFAGAELEALAIFQGPQAYVSPSWYPSKREHGKVVPTWNYVTVHAHGRLRIHDDAAWVRRLLDRLTGQMESPRAQPRAVSDAPPDYIEKMVAQVVGVELRVERLVGKWKVSQNQPAANRAGVIAGLEADGDAQAVAMAREVSGRARGEG